MSAHAINEHGYTGKERGKIRAHLVDAGDEPARSALRPLNPLLAELSLQGIVFPLHPRDEHDEDVGIVDVVQSDQGASDIRVHRPALRQPRPRSRQHDDGTDGEGRPRGVARVTHERVRTISDELVAVDDAEVVGELTAEVVKAGDTEEGAQRRNEPSHHKKRGDGELVREGRVAKGKEREDWGGGLPIREDHRHLNESDEPNQGLRRTQWIS